MSGKWSVTDVWKHDGIVFASVERGLDRFDVQEYQSDELCEVLNAKDAAEAERDALAEKLRVLREAAANYMDAHDRYAEEPDLDWEQFDRDTAALADAIHAASGCPKCATKGDE